MLEMDTLKENIQKQISDREKNVKKKISDKILRAVKKGRTSVRVWFPKTYEATCLYVEQELIDSGFTVQSDRSKVFLTNATIRWDFLFHVPVEKKIGYITEEIK